MPGAPVTPRKCESERATPHKSERPEGMDDGADRVRRTWRGMHGRQSGSRRAGRSDLLPLQCDGESGVHSPFR